MYAMRLGQDTEIDDGGVCGEGMVDRVIGWCRRACVRQCLVLGDFSTNQSHTVLLYTPFI
jgi:hypothetical protein